MAEKMVKKIPRYKKELSQNTPGLPELTIREEYFGLFGLVSGGTITNLAIENVDIDGGAFVGAVAGYVMNNSTITNCATINNNVKAKDNAGRITGIIDYGSALISNNFALNTMSATGSAKFDTADTKLHGVSETLINCLCGMKRKAHGTQKPRHINGIVEVASTAQRSDSPAQAINQGFLSKTDAQLRQQSTYSDAIIGDGLGGLGWKFGSNETNPWKMPSGGGYPILYWQ